ncbi:hypothetical protein COP2_019737 [Malus domestica]
MFTFFFYLRTRIYVFNNAADTRKTPNPSLSHQTQFFEQWLLFRVKVVTFVFHLGYTHDKDYEEDAWRLLEVTQE